MNISEVVTAAHRAFVHDRLDDALILLQAVEHVPSPRLWLLRANLHRERCEPDRARAALERARTLGAGDETWLRQALMWRPIMEAEDGVRREVQQRAAALGALLDRPLDIDDPVNQLPWLDFYLAYRGAADRPLREDLSTVLRQACPDLVWTAPHVADGPSTSGKVRLGFCSSHLKDHTIGRLNQALVRGLGPHGFHVVLAVTEMKEDPLFSAMAAAADEVIVLGRDLVAARERLAAARLDLLHYPDLGMDPFLTWMAHARLAPLQTVSWGHPITTGMPTIDAFLASETLVPVGAEIQFSERVVRVPDPMVCWRPPAAPAAIPKADLGLPEGRRVYLVPQTAFKLHPAFDRVLGKILDADPDGVLALLEPSRRSWRAALEARFAQTFDPAGVVWVPRQPRRGFLNLLRTADVILDPFPFAGGHTSLEALAMGTPIITLPTDQLRGRLTHCWYRVMGLGSLSCPDEQTYVERAVAWARDGAAVRRRIELGRHLLFDRQDAVAGHAAAFHGLVAQASCVARAA